MQIKYNEGSYKVFIEDDYGTVIESVVIPESDWNDTKYRLHNALNPQDVRQVERDRYERELGKLIMPCGNPLPKDVIGVIMMTKYPPKKKNSL